MLRWTAILLGALVVSAVPAGSAVALVPCSTEQDVPLTVVFRTDSHAAEHPATSSRYVVWQDRRDGNWDIYAFDLVNEREIQITHNESDQLFPRISADIIVWQDLRDGVSNIYGYDLVGKREFMIHSGVGWDTQPNISGEYVVWKAQYQCLSRDCRFGAGAPMAKNLRTGEAWQLSAEKIPWGGIGLSGRVAWWYLDYEPQAYDLVTNERISFPGLPQAASDGRFAVWFTGENGYGLYAYDPLTGESSYLGDMEGLAARARRYAANAHRNGGYVWTSEGFWLIWEESGQDRHGVYYQGIYAYDFAEQKKKRLTVARDVMEELPTVSRNIVSWEERPSGCGTHVEGGVPECSIDIVIARLGSPDRKFDLFSSVQRVGDAYSATIFDYEVTDSSGICFAEAFQRLGGTETLGQPASYRFQLAGEAFTYQLTQGALLQWRPEVGGVYLGNTFEMLERAGRDDWLFAAKGIPRPIEDDGSGGNWNRARETRLSWLTNEKIRIKYLSNPNPEKIDTWNKDRSIELYGLPMSYPERHGPFISQRFQRVAFQLWVEEVEGMPAPGTVVRVLGGDLLKEAGFIPPQALAAEERPKPKSLPDPPTTATFEISWDWDQGIRTPGGKFSATRGAFLNLYFPQQFVGRKLTIRQLGVDCVKTVPGGRDNTNCGTYLMNLYRSLVGPVVAGMPYNLPPMTSLVEGPHAAELVAGGAYYKKIVWEIESPGLNFVYFGNHYKSTTQIREPGPGAPSTITFTVSIE